MLSVEADGEGDDSALVTSATIDDSQLDQNLMHSEAEVLRMAMAQMQIEAERISTRVVQTTTML